MCRKGTLDGSSLNEEVSHWNIYICRQCRIAVDAKTFLSGLCRDAEIRLTSERI
jgi:hypothetical protein